MTDWASRRNPHRRSQIGHEKGQDQLTSQDDEVTSQLKGLRGRTGISRERLEKCGALLSALGTSDTDEAYEKLLDVIGQLKVEEAQMIRLDYAIDLDSVFGRPAHPSDLAKLDTRRLSFSRLRSIGVKTISRHSDAAISELRNRLLNDTYTGDLHVVAVVQDRHIVSISLVQDELGSDATPESGAPGQISRRRSLDYLNPSDQPSLPCMVYAFPRDWQPTTLTLAVSFLDDQSPASVWAFQAPNFIEANFAKDRYELIPKQGMAMCRFQEPRRDRIYGIWWGRLE